MGKAVKAVVTNELDLFALYNDPKASVKGLGFTLEVKLWTKLLNLILFKN